MKPAKTFEEQIDILKSRGLIIEDENFAIKILSEISYYRLSAYSLSLRENNMFHKGVTFNQIYKLYEFDTKFRHVLMSSIEIIEIKFRTKLAHHLAINHGPTSYLESELFTNYNYHKSFIQGFEYEKERQKEVAFVKHHIENYGGQMPVWAAFEICTFGMISKLYSNLKAKYQKQFVQEMFNKPKWFNQYLSSWLYCLVEIRNICAHYGRIYNRNLNSIPKIKIANQCNFDKNSRKIFNSLIPIIVLLEDDSKKKTFITNISALIEEYEEVLNLDLIGFPINWEEILRMSSKKWTTVLIKN